MGFWDRVTNRKQNLTIWDSLYDEDESRKIAFKRMAIESVIGRISKTIIQSEFRVKKKDEYIKDKMYYKFNVKPNLNQSAPSFWEEVVFKLIYDGECLIVNSRQQDLLIADDYEREEFAVYEDKFSSVWVKGMELDGEFKRSEVLFLEYGNEKLSSLIDSLFYDYGRVINHLVESQLRKGQLRASVEIDATFSKTEEGQTRVQTFIDRTLDAIRNKSVAFFPLQKGMEYKEHSSNAGSTSSASVEEINKITNGFLDQVAIAVGMPTSFLHGDMADSEQTTRNYMRFCIDPLITIISGELNKQFVSERSYLKGDEIEVKRISVKDIFEIAESVDKLRSSSVMDGNEIRDAMGLPKSDDEAHKKLIMTKNYEGAERDNDQGDEEEDEM